MKAYRIKRGGAVFYAVMRGAGTAHFIELKKHWVTGGDALLEAAVRYAAQWARDERAEIITTAPSSGKGESWAPAIAKRIGAAADIDFVTVFFPHGFGRRYALAKKFDRLPYQRTKIDLTGRRVLLFDDFAHTGGTITGALEILQKECTVMGLVLGAT